MGAAMLYPLYYGINQVNIKEDNNNNNRPCKRTEATVEDQNKSYARLLSGSLRDNPKRISWPS